MNSAIHPIMQQAMKAFMPPAAPAKPATNNTPPTPAELADFYEFQTTINGVVLDCFIEYEAAFDGSDDEPGYDETIALMWALADGVPVTGLLDECDVEEIEARAKKSMGHSKFNSELDRAADLYEDREFA